MQSDGQYVYPLEFRQALESLPVALAVYQYVQGRVVTLLVSEGMCRMFGAARAELIRHMDEDMFGCVYPDDREMLVSLGYNFATKESPYDVIYRTRLFGREDYRTMHVVGEYQTMENGIRLANLVYCDITDTPTSLSRARESVSLPKVRYMDEYLGAMAIVSREGERLLYSNKAMHRLLPPKCALDSGVTFSQYFFGVESSEFDRIFRAAEEGIHVVEVPDSRRKYDVNLLSCTYADEPAFAAYFFEHIETDPPPVVNISRFHSRATFDFSIFTGESNRLPYYSSGYRGYRVWNLSRDELVLLEASNLLFSDLGDSPSFDDYLKRIQTLICDTAQQKLLFGCSRERLLQLFQSGTYPRQFQLTLQTEHGVVHAAVALTMMRAPNCEDVYLKIEEKNVSDEVILAMLVQKTVEQDYDFVAYSDLSADLCRIISGHNTASGQKSYIIKTSEQISKPSDIRSFPRLFPDSVQTLEEMHQYLLTICGSDGRYSALQELPGGVVKSIYFELVNAQTRSFFIRCKDVTTLLRKERQQKSALELAVRAEHDKVEHVLVQTVLSISNALDARDPLTRRHSQRVAQYSAEIARRLRWSEESIQNLYNIALVHDIGKIGIPDAVLQKKGRLTNEEYLEIQNHVAIGAFILKDFTAFDKVAEGALFHHERYDGAGYLRGLAGEEIPVEARIIGLADAVDAMNSIRPYRARQSEEYIRSELIANRGRQFDPALVDIMLEMIDGGVLNT